MVSPGIRRVSFHTLRHSAATIMLAQGVPERVIMDVLGHATAAMMVRYQQVTDALRDDAASAMDRAFRSPGEGRAPTARAPDRTIGRNSAVNSAVKDEAPGRNRGLP